MLIGFRDFFSSQSLVFDSSRESSFKFDFTKNGLKEKGVSNQSRVKGISSLILLLLLFLFSNFLSAQVTVDGNPIEWGTAAVTGQPIYSYQSDPFGNGVVDNQFTKGSKDFMLAADQRWVIGQTKAKNDIANGAAVLIGTNLYFAGDRTSNNGDAQIGFWFYLNGTGPAPEGNFAPPHVVGDLLILANFTNGGRNALVTVYKWVGTGGNVPNTGGTLNTTNATGIIAQNNDAVFPIPVGWSFISPNYLTNEFYEGEVDLASLGLSNFCFASFLLEARSSQSITASLDDFVGGAFGGVPDIPTPGPVARCGAGSVNLTASGCAGGTLKWYATATSTTVLVTGPTYTTPSITETTSYFVSCTNVNGCESKRAEVKATINPNPTVTVNSGDRCISGTNSAPVLLTATHNAANPSFLWSTGENTASISVSPSITTPYTVTVTNGTTGCSNSASNTVTVNPLPPITCPAPLNTNVACGVSEVIAQQLANASFATWLATGPVAPAGHSIAVTYAYSAGAAPNPVGTAPLILAFNDPSIISTSVTVTWTITNTTTGCVNSCNSTFTLQYTCAPGCTTQVTNLTCFGNSSGTITVTVQGGTPPYTATLFLSSNLVTPIVNATNPGTGIGEGGSYTFTGLAANAPGVNYVVITTDTTTTIADGGVCTATLTEPSAVSCTIAPTNPLCFGGTDGSLTASGSGGTGAYEYSLNGGTFQASGTFTGLVANVLYTVTTRDINLCTSTCTVTLTQPDAVVAKDENTKANCVEGKDGSVTLTFSGGTPPYMVNFNSGGFATQTSPITYSGLSVGTYNWTVKDANECSVPGSEDVGFIPCAKALCTYTQGYYGNVGGMSCAEGKSYTTTALITKALGYYGGTMVVGYGLNTVSISSPSCVIAALPGGGGSYKLSGAKNICSLPSSYLKNGRINNTLLAQTIALGLNIGINSALGDFALKAGTLATAAPDGGCGTDIPKLRSCSAEGYMPVINEYKYYTMPAVVDLLPNKTVQGLYDMANKALGGEVLPAGISLSNLASAVDLINNAFDGCRISMGYEQKPLGCIASSPQEFVAFEVPIVNNQLTIKYKFSYVSDVTIDVFDTATGAKVFTKKDTNSYLGKEVKLDYNFNTGTQKVYIVRLTTRLGHDEQKVISSPY